MKKFRGIKRRQKKERNYGAWIVVLLGGLMILSTAGFLMNYSEETSTTTRFGDHSVIARPEGLFIEIEGVERAFTYYPDSVEDVQPHPSVVDWIRNARVIGVTYDVNISEAEYFGSVQYSLEEAWREDGKYVIRGFTDGEGYVLPTVRCANATQQMPVIRYELGEKTQYVVQEYCILGQVSHASDVIRLRDALLYAQYGVIDYAE